MSLHSVLVWVVSLVSIALVLIRPRGLPEAIWSSIGASVLIIFRLISPRDAWTGIGKGLDVYLFLAGMMIIAELARREGVFEWLARYAVNVAKGSRTRLFLLIYGVGVVVTILLSNDATAVVLTPAVQAAVRTAQADPLPFLFICAFIANAASFVLPISNPANLVVYQHSGLPPLKQWLLVFTAPSLVSIVVTFFLLRFLSRKLLAGEMRQGVDGAALSATGRLTLYGIFFLVAAVLTASAFGKDLGLPSFLAGILVAATVTLRDREVPRDLAREVAWSVIPLVAGLFVIVEAMNGAGALRVTVAAIQNLKSWPMCQGALSSSFGIALISNLMNNLPSGLIGGAAVNLANATGPLRDAILIGVDLGPNLSITGSLATVLWLIAIRREGQTVGFWEFLRWGVVVMPPALALAALALLARAYA